jgi:hypothetical protein
MSTMSQDLPRTGNQVIDTMTEIFHWLGKQIDQFIPRPPAPPLPAPADMTDRQLHQAVHRVGAGLLNGLAPVIQQGFARYGSAAEMGDPRFPHAMPVKVRGHVLTMVTKANDAFGLSLLGLRQHATAAALGAIRIAVETLAWARWLLESPDEDARQARAYRLTLNGIEGYRRVGETLRRVAGQSEETEERAAWLTAAGQRMKDDLTALASQDGASIPANPGSLSRLIEQYLPEHGGYLFYALLNSAGAHPGAARAFQFYGTPGTGIDYDFKGKHHVRAYWIAQSTLLHLDMCDLAAPVLGWGQEWEALAGQPRNQLGPLAEEAGRRYIGPLQRAMANKPDLDRPASPGGQPPGTDSTT